MPRSRWMDGSATFTTVLSSMIMKSANASAPSVHHLRLSSAKILALTPPLPPRGSRRLRYRRRPGLRRAERRFVHFPGMAEVVWTPDERTLAHANVVRLMRKHGLDDYRELVRRSQEDPAWFWPAAIEDLGLEFSRPWERVYDDSRGPEWTTWFVGSQVSIARNCVHRWAERPPDEVGAVFAGEDGSRRELTFAELSRDVTRLAEGLVRLGVEPGDRVAIYMPMCPEVAVASHACAHMGAVQVPVFSGFAAPAVRQRLEASESKVVVCANGSFRRGKWIPMREIVDEAAQGLDVPVIEWDRRAAAWPDEVAGQPGTLPALDLESEHPYLLTYTSGTTGQPKGR